MGGVPEKQPAEGTHHEAALAHRLKGVDPHHTHRRLVRHRHHLQSLPLHLVHPFGSRHQKHSAVFIPAQIPQFVVPRIGLVKMGEPEGVYPRRSNRNQQRRAQKHTRKIEQRQ